MAFVGCTSLISIYCFAETPPKGSNLFDNATYTWADLFVPIGCISNYKTTQYSWRNFKIIEEFDTTDISQIEATDETELMQISTFDTSGHKLSQPKKGLSIILMSDGSVKKVIAK